MSPEQATGARVDGRSDIYSLACVVYELLAGEPPHRGATAQAVIAKVVTEKPSPLTSHRDTVPPHVDAAVAKALAKVPADRFGKAMDFAAALADPRLMPALPGVLVEQRSRRLALADGGVGLLMVGLIMGWFARRGGSSEGGPPVHAQIFAPPEYRLTYGVPALSPDGRLVAFSGSCQTVQSSNTELGQAAGCSLHRHPVDVALYRHFR